MSLRRSHGSQFLGILAGLVLCVTASASEKDREHPLQGSIKVEGKHKQAELQKMAKVAPEQADTLALAAAAGAAPDKRVVDHELEVEDGCLVYSIEVKVKGTTGVEEILIDAGDGKVLEKETEKD